MNNRPHSNSIFKSRMVTNGERHRRRSRLIIRARSARAWDAQARFIRRLGSVLLFVSVLAILIFIVVKG